MFRPPLSVLPSPIGQRLMAYARLLRWHRPIGFVLLLWPTLCAVWLASGGDPDFGVIGLFGLGAFLMRSAGCAVNDWADRHFDGHVRRTCDRPLATGQLQPGEALGCALLCALLAAAVLLSLTHSLRVWAWAVMALVVAATYPFFKRFFAMPQAYLGLAFGMGIPMAFELIQGQVPASAWLFMVGNAFWAVAYDTEYAMVDREDDRLLGLRTSALTLGRWDVLGVMVCYAVALCLWFVVGLKESLGFVYHAGLLIAALIAVYHGHLIAQRDPVRCMVAFRHNAWLGAALWGGLVVDCWVR